MLEKSNLKKHLQSKMMIKNHKTLEGEIQMKDVFGNVMYEGKMINVDKEDIENLKKISKDLKEKNKKLEEKIEKIFCQ